INSNTVISYIFFFQAEDGIRDFHVTGVQTCALPIFSRDASGVTATLASGETIQARLLVAADGRGSPVRRAAGIKTVGWSYDQTGIVCTVAHEIPHYGVAQERFLRPGPFAILPMTGNRSSLVWTEQTDRAK